MESGTASSEASSCFAVCLVHTEPQLMNYSMPHVALVETLLNTLEAERYMRAPLLLTIVDELSTDEALAPAAELAREMVAVLQSGEILESEFAAHLGALRSLVQTLSAPPESEVRVKGVPDALARAVVRHGATASAA